MVNFHYVIYTYEVARDIKASHQLERKNIIEKYEIERRYWKHKNIDWGIVTNKEIPKRKVKNIEWIYPSLELDKNEVISKKEKEYLCGVLLENIYRKREEKTREIIQDMEWALNLEEGIGLTILKYLIAKKVIHVNMEEKIDLNLPPESLIISINKKGGERKYASNS